MDQDPAGICQPIKVEKFEAGLWAFIAMNGDVQIGWCRKTQRGWQVEDMDGNCLSEPFKTLTQAEQAGAKALAHMAGSANPGW